MIWQTNWKLDSPSSFCQASLILNIVKYPQKSHKREAPNLSTCADSSTDTKTNRKHRRGHKRICIYLYGWSVRCHMSGVTCQVSCVMCHVLRVVCHLSPITWHLLTCYMSTVTNTNSHSDRSFQNKKMSRGMPIVICSLAEKHTRFGLKNLQT